MSSDPGVQNTSQAAAFETTAYALPRVRRMLLLALAATGLVALLAIALCSFELQQDRAAAVSRDRVERQRVLAALIDADAVALTYGIALNADRAELTGRAAELAQIHAWLSDAFVSNDRTLELRTLFARVAIHHRAIQTGVEQVLAHASRAPGVAGDPVPAVRRAVQAWIADMDGIDIELLRARDADRAHRLWAYVALGVLTSLMLTVAWLRVCVPTLSGMSRGLQSSEQALWRSGVDPGLSNLQQQERASAAMLAEAEALARLGSWSFDLRAQKVEWSAQMYVLFGRESSLGPPDYQTAIDYYVPEDRAWLERSVQAAAESATPYHGVLRLKTPRNGVAVIRAQAKVSVDAAGKATRIFGTVIDITASVLREEALELAQANAEAASQAKSAFLANTSHEIRTPMAAILGYLELLAEEGVTREQSLEYNAIMQRNAKHLLDLINQVLDLSKIEAGQMTTELIACDPGTLVREVASLMRPLAIEKGIEFSVEFRGAIPSTIQTDPTRLRQIVLNLVSNAVKFTERGSVTLVAALAWNQRTPQLELQVRDTGIGIEPKVLANLFKPFTQGDESTTRRFGGTGLGLSIASHLCRLLGGTIEAVSTPGVGTVFTARVETGSLEGVQLFEGQRESEALSSQAAMALQEQSPAKPLQGLVLLLVEDGADNQRLISLHLRRAGATVEVLGNGQLAVDRLCDKEQPECAVVLMDMQMPVMDGYAATAALRRRGYFGAIIALTAHALSGERKKCLDAGCDDYATKPIDVKFLVSLVQRHARVPRGSVLAPPVLAGRVDVAAVSAPMSSGGEQDPELVELMNQFARSVAELAAQVERALEAGDAEQLTTLVHQLKGAGGCYGFNSISEAAARVEGDVIAGMSKEHVRASVAELVSSCGAVRSLAAARVANSNRGTGSWRARS
jgi:signal transduction histidine kinase/DNA-binding response OmpR family regulator